MLIQFRFLFIGLYLILPSLLLSQSITVVVKGEQSLTIDQLEVYVNVTETTYDFVQVEYPNLNIPKPIDHKDFENELDQLQLKVTLTETISDSKKYYEKSTKKEQVKTTSNFHYQVSINDKEDLNKLTTLKYAWPNIKITSTDFQSKNEELTIKALTNELLSKACLLYTSPSPRDQRGSRMPSSA